MKLKYILCCDWGTSSLRIRLIDTGNYRIIDEQNTDEGIATIFQLWKAQENDHAEDRVKFYLAQLHQTLHQLKLRNGDIANIPLIISGMASSTLGIMELPYANLPFSLNGSDAMVYEIDASEEMDHPVILISGVKSDDEVMRGEEVQAAGAFTFAHIGNEDVLLILPGTHSKHLQLKSGKVQKINTYMTGEVFSILASNGSLKDTVDLSDTNYSARDWDIFLQGIDYSEKEHLLQALFKVRTNYLLKNLPKKQNSIYLSGLLIGYELRSLLAAQHDKIVLCSDHKLHHHYQKALIHLGLDTMTTYINPDDFPEVTVRGQILIAEPYLKKIQTNGKEQYSRL